MNIPKDLLYTKEHEWIKIEGDTATIGITDYAQSSLGDIAYIELPQKGDTIKQAERFSTVESVKAASDIYAPMSGEIISVDDDLNSSPELINKSCYQDGWIIKIKISNLSEKANLMDADTYNNFVKELAH